MTIEIYMTGGLLRKEQGEARYERHDGDTDVRNWSDHNKAGETLDGVEPWLIRV